MTDPWVVLGCLVVEVAVGYPRAWPHPVAWPAKFIAYMEARWNKGKPSQKNTAGIVTVLMLSGMALLVGLVLQLFLPALIVALIATVGLAQRSLYDHVAAVLKPLQQGNLSAAREALARIVGRDVDGLDDAGVSAAALESLSESFNDGVVAPAFWFLVAGLPGLLIYKVINTADSLIGHKEPRWKDFGWAAARTDDLLNLIPARIAGGVIALVGKGGWRTMFADAMKHASPNSGWPEAAMAGALNVRLGGEAFYDGVAHERPVLGTGPRPSVAHLQSGLHLYMRACLLLWAILAAGGFLWRL